MNEIHDEKENRVLSVIIPHYNSPDSLERLLISIGENDGLEVIVIDDKSDKYVEKYNHVKNKYGTWVKFYDNVSINKGAGAARNIGLKHATGKWVTFMDSDDVVVKDLISVCSRLNDDMDMIFFEPISKKTDLQKATSRHLRYKRLVEQYKKEATESNMFALKYNFYVPWSKIIKLELIRQHNICFEEVLYANDVMFSCRVAFWAKNISVQDDIFYCVTENDFGLTKVKNEYSKYIRNKQEIKRMFYLMTHVPVRYWKIVEVKIITIMGLIKKVLLYESVTRRKKNG